MSKLNSVLFLLILATVYKSQHTDLYESQITVIEPSNLKLKKGAEHEKKLVNCMRLCRQAKQCSSGSGIPEDMKVLETEKNMTDLKLC